MSRFNALQIFWQGLAARERTGVALAATAVTAMLLWWLALSPALHTLALAQTQASQLETQLQTMHALQAQARALQAQPKMGHDEAVRALESSVRQRLGASAQFTLQGDRAMVTLKGVSAEALAQWLTLARVNARSVPIEARLQRSAVPAATANAAVANWDGSLVLGLPAR